MKKYFIWSFDRGSRPYDIICAIILAFIFLTPPSAFNDRPDYMRVVAGDPVRQHSDNNGNTVYTVQIETPAFSNDNTAQSAALSRLRASIGHDFTVARINPIYGSMGALVAYAIWIER